MAMTPEIVSPEDQKRALARARVRAFRFKKGESGNPAGSSAITKAYWECRRLARMASLDMLRNLIDLANDPNQDGRVRSVCSIAVLDRAGIRPIDFDPNEEKSAKPKFNPRDYTPEELDVIEAALKLMIRGKAASGVGDKASMPLS